MSNDQRKRVIKTALAMYIEQGVKAVRMDDIAREMHISKRTIYELCGDKEELLFQAMTLYLEGLSAELDEVGKSAPNILIAMLEVAKYLTQRSHITWRLRRSISQFYPAVHERILAINSDEKYSIFKACLIEGVELGLIKDDVNVDLFISMLYYICTAIVSVDENLIIPEGMSREEAFCAAQATIIRGVSTPRGMEEIDNYLAKK